jgi:hypothetical protein
MLKNLSTNAKAIPVVVLLSIFVMATYVHAATSPSLGAADSFAILSSTYTNTLPGTTVNGNLGYTTGPASAPTVNGATHVADATYAQAGTDQGTTLTSLNSQSCDHTFASGAVDLAANTDFPTAVYPPGVYCINGAATIGPAGITLSGSGTYIFRVTGSLSTVDNSVINLSGGASSNNIWWTPSAAATLGANSSFVGTVIDNTGITIGANTSLTGRALAFGGTISTNSNTITSPSYGGPPPPTPSATLTLTKIVINDNGGTKVVADFPLFIGASQVTSGVATTTLAPGTYTASETSDPAYTASAWSGDCAANGAITLANGDVKACSITNNDNAPTSTPPASGGAAPLTAISGNFMNSAVVSTIASTTTPLPVIAPVAAAPMAVVVHGVTIPKLPNTGIGPDR